MRSDLTLRPEKPPRALIISTGEDTPVGQSLRARTLISELDKGELDFGVLTRCQEDAAAGLYASAMAGYVEYLSRDYAAIRADLKAARAELRAHAGRHGQHRRTTNIVADLALGLRYFLWYAMDCGAVGKEEAREIWAKGWQTLCKVGDEQADQQAASEPTERFSELLRAAISGGMAHLEHATHADHVPGDPVGWGWRSTTKGSGDFEREEWQPQGTRVGWIREDGLYLQPDTALKLARDMGRDSSDPVSLTKTTLGKRMRDKGILLSTGAVEGRESITVRRQFGGRRDAYLHVPVSYLSPGVEKPDQSDHEGQNAFRYKDSRGQVPDLEPDHDPEGDQKPDHDRNKDVEGRL